MLFYRYQRSDLLAFAMLRRGEIFFASPSELNDAHEFRPEFILNGTAALWQRLAHYILMELALFGAWSHRFDKCTAEKVLLLATKAGTALKKRVRSSDLPIGRLGALFIEVMTPLLSQLFGKTPLEEIVIWLRHFIDEELTNRMHESHYVACFSMNCNNPTMWGHYAQAEKGFAIIYTTNDSNLHVHSPLKLLHGTRATMTKGLYTIGLYSDEHLGLRQVRYRKRPPRVNAFHQLIPLFHYSHEEEHYDVPLLLPGDAPKKEERTLGLVKFSDWKYERELRAFLPCVGFRSRNCEPLCPDARVLRVSGENICGLVFGPRMSPANKQRAVTCCRLMRKCQVNETESDFAFFQAEHQHDRYALRIRPLGLLEQSSDDCKRHAWRRWRRSC